MNIKGAIFDLDGTLLDSMPAWDNLAVRFMEDLGATPPSNLDDILLSMTPENGAKYCCSEFNLPMTPAEFLNDINGLLKKFYSNEVTLKSGVYDFLEKLHNEDVKICLATANYADLALAGLKCTGIFKFMDEIVTCADVGVGKESPAIYDEALKRIGTPKGDTVVFEDALYAVKTANNAGYRVIGIYDKAEKDNQSEIDKLTEQFIFSYEEILL